MDIAISISNRELTPAVVNFFQHENETVRLNFTLDSYIYGEVDLRNYKAYGITSQNGMIDMTELEMNYNSSEDKLVLLWEVQEYSLRQEGAITYQICFKENADDGENTAVFYTYKGIMINRGSLDGDNHITANYPTILKQLLDRINELAGVYDAGIVYIRYGESLPSTERLAGRVYFQYTDSANTKGRFEDHEGKELDLSAYLSLNGGTMNGAIISNIANFLKRNVDTANLIITGGTESSKNAYMQLYGGSASNNKGAFIIGAIDADGNIASLKGLPDGNLTWDGKNVVRSVEGASADSNGNVILDISNKYLSLAGGTMTGDVKNNKTDFVVGKDNKNGRLVLRSGTDFYNGASLYLNGNEYSSNPGQFQLNAGDPENGNLVKYLKGTADGNLTWGGYRINRNVNDEAIYLIGGTSADVSSYLQLLGGNNSNGGQFNLVAKEADGTAYTLNGTADGSLSWGAKEILTEEKLKVVKSLPSSPVEGSFYYITE